MERYAAIEFKEVYAGFKLTMLRVLLLAGFMGVQSFVSAEEVFVYEPSVLTLDTLRIVDYLPVEKAEGPVDGYAAKRSASATKTDTAILETPQSISVVSKEQLEARNVTTIEEAIRYTPGVSVPNGYDSRYDWISLRGFASSNIVYRDGLKLTSSYFGSARVDPYMLERVEVIRGPMSVLYGQGLPGGFVNAVTKRPTFDPLQEVRIDVGSNNFVKLGGDFGGQLDDLGDVLYRLTLAGVDADTQVDENHQNRFFVAPSISWHINSSTDLTLFSSYQKDDIVSSFNIHSSSYMPDLIGRFEKVAKSVAGIFGVDFSIPIHDIERDFFIGEPDFDQFDRVYSSLGYEFVHVFNDGWSFKQKFRFDDITLDYDVINTIFGNVVDGTLLRNSLSVEESVQGVGLDSFVQGDFLLAGMDHTLLLGIDVKISRADEVRYDGNAPTLSFLDPQYGLPFDDPTLTYDREVDSQQVGIYLQSQLDVTERFRMTLGGRYDKFSNDSSGDRVSSGESVEFENNYSDTAFSGRAGFLYLFDDGLAPYISYSESFNPTTDTNELTGEPFDPEFGEQIELGLKYQPLDSGAFFAMAVYDLTKKNVIVSDQNNVKYQVGEINALGLEMEAMLSLGWGLDLRANYTYTDAKVTKTLRAWEKDTRVSQQPKSSAGLWLDYTKRSGMLRGMGMGVGLRYTGESRYTQDVTTVFDAKAQIQAFVPAEYGAIFDLVEPLLDNVIGDPIVTGKSESYTLMDMSMHYQTGGLKLAMNINNVLDKEYDASCDAFTCFYGYGREVKSSATYSW